MVPGASLSAEAAEFSVLEAAVWLAEFAAGGPEETCAHDMAAKASTPADKNPFFNIPIPRSSFPVGSLLL